MPAIHAPSLAFAFVIEGSSNAQPTAGTYQIGSIDLRVVVPSDAYIIRSGDFNVITGVQFGLGGAAGGVGLQTGSWFAIHPPNVLTVTLEASVSDDADVQGTWGAQAHVIVLPRAS